MPQKTDKKNEDEVEQKTKNEDQEDTENKDVAVKEPKNTTQEDEPEQTIFEDSYDWYMSLSLPDRTILPIVLVNILVYLAWQVHSWEPFMYKYFAARFDKHAFFLPMILSNFSHMTILHLTINMYVLYGYSQRAVTLMGWKQFVVAYVAAGLVSSLTSHFYNSYFRTEDVSVGASGAVMFVIGYVCFDNPDSLLAVAFLPEWTFEAGLGLLVLFIFDTLGCIFKWEIFDHAAHLGGLIFGVLWSHFGDDFVWRPLAYWWYRITGAI